jgi:hypothetical protein
VVGLGEGEGAECLAARQGGQPPPLLLLGAEVVDRPHGESCLDAGEGRQAAVAAGQLHRHQPGAGRTHGGHTRVVDAVADQAQLAHPAHQVGRELGALPEAVDHGKDLVVDEGTGAPEVVAFLVAELGGDPDEVRSQCCAHVRHARPRSAGTAGTARRPLVPAACTEPLADATREAKCCITPGGDPGAA